VIVNLLTNAYRYGGSEVRLTATRDDGRVRLTVTDDGAGVGEELLPHLFEPFTRGRASRDVEGSGLGLAITRGLTEAQGGRLWYERADHGARFIVELRAT
jgi:signal transduction histidine kinase